MPFPHTARSWLEMFRLLRWAAFLAAAIAGLALTKLEVQPDLAVAGAIVRAGHEPVADPHIRQVDLGVDESRVWDATLAFLNAILKHRGGAAPPQVLVLDTIFSTGSKTDVAPSDLAAAIAGVRKLGTRVVLAVDPFKPGSDSFRDDFSKGLVTEIYDAASGRGQTYMRVGTDLARDAILVYPAWLEDGLHNQYIALPLIARRDDAEPSDAHFTFVVGNRSAMPSYSLTDIERDPGKLSDEYVVVGSRVSLDQADRVRGIDAVAWALSDRLSAGAFGHQTVFADSGLATLLTLAACGLSIVLFSFVYARIRGRAGAAWIALPGAIAVPIAALVAFYEILASHGSIFLQPTLAMFASVITGGVCVAAARDLPQPATKRVETVRRVVSTAGTATGAMARPGGAIARRELPFFWVCDVSGSMAGGSINALNVAVRETLPAMRDEAKSFPNARISMRSIAFSSGARWIERAPVALADFQWTDLEATDGESDLGAAIELALEALDPATLAPGHFPPILVLVSDGLATDSTTFERALQALVRHPVASKATRVPIGLGPDADYASLQRFGSVAPLRAEDASELAELIDIVARSTVGIASSVAVDDGTDPLERELERLRQRRAVTWDPNAPSEDVW